MKIKNLKTDVVIVGAGTSGMVAALCLAKWNVKSIIVEKNLGVNEHPYLNISQSEIEKVLRKTIKENPNIDFLSGHTWQSVEYIGDTLIAKVEDIKNDKNIIIDAKYLLGADGANSPVRKTLEIQMSGHGIIGNFVNVYFDNNLRSFIKKPAKLYWIVNPAAA